MIYHNTTAFDAVNSGRDMPDDFYHKSTMIGTSKRMTDALPAGWYTYRRNWIMYLHRPGLNDIEIVDGTEYAPADYNTEED